MFAEEEAAERGREFGGLPRATCEGRGYCSAVSYNDGDFGVVVAVLAAIVYVCAAANDDLVISDEKLEPVRGPRYEGEEGELTLL
jgi:hypothetical protein